MVNIQFDALVLQIAPPLTVARDTVFGLAESLFVSAVLAIGMTHNRPGAAPSTSDGLAGRLWLRVPGAALSYVVLYLVAGSLILPFVRYFYQSTRLVVVPPLGILLGITFLRGLIYVAATVPLLRVMAGRRGQAAFVTGLSLSVFGGVVPLLLPNDILPPEVRGVHMLEIFGSNFILGVIFAFLLVRRTPSPHARTVAAPA